MPKRIRMDKGTETGVMATMHCYLLEQVLPDEDPVNSVIYGSSMNNRIERWWRELHERLEVYFKEQLKQLLDQGDYDRHCMFQR